MSSITNSVKEKDPRRVEAGRKLGAVSKALKAAKAAREAKDDETGLSEDREDCEGGYSAITVITGVGVLSGLVCLYLTYKRGVKAVVCEQDTQSTKPADTVSTKPPTGRKPISLG